MAEPEDMDGLAGEYVLGTLDPAERRAVAQRMLTDPAMARAVAYWTDRLAPLALTIPDETPPAGLYDGIERRIAPAPATANDNRGGAAGWRAAAIAASLVAVLATGVAIRGPTQLAPAAPPATPAAQPMMAAVAALNADGAPPAMVVAYDKAHARIQIIPMAMDEPAGRSLELWMIEGKAAPKSMGTMKPGEGAAFRGLAVEPKTQTVFAISIEPVGGSPTGAPTGPVVYSGELTSIPGT